MGFRNPITNAVDQVARDAAAAAQDTASNGIIPGSRLAADAIDGKTITGATLRTAGAASQRVQIDSANGLIVYDAAGNVIVSLAPGGKLTTLSGAGGHLVLDGNIDGGGSGGGLVLQGGTGTTDGVVRTDVLTSSGKPYGRRTILNPGATSGYTGTPATITVQTTGLIDKFSGALIGPFTSLVEIDADTVTIPGTLRLPSTVDASETSTGHAFQIGDDAGQNVIIDNNEMMGRNNGVGTSIYAQYGFSLGANAVVSDQSAIPRLYVTSRFAAGVANITPTAANTPTSVAVSFGKTFASPPVVLCTPNTTGPGTLVTGVAATSITTTGFTCWLTRSNTTVTSVFWSAIDTAF